MTKHWTQQTLAEELQEKVSELEKQLESYQSARVHDVDEKAWLSKRMTELEAALLWYQNQHTLHFSLELLYCVDHYELSKVDESERVMWMTSGETLLECIKAASTADGRAES